MTHEQNGKFAFIGMDEAGYGPNLGPLVISTTRWQTPDAASETNFYQLLSPAVDSQSNQKFSRLHIADSKEVFSGQRGLASLETSALAILNCLGMPVNNFQSLWEGVSQVPYPAEIPWFVDPKLKLPVVADLEVVDQLSTQLQSVMGNSGLVIREVKSQIITARHFNQLLERDGSKGITLSRLAFKLLREVWDPAEADSILFVGDKHGGRNRYDELLSEVLDGEMIFRIEEGRARSRYRIGKTELSFQTKGEQHFPVAVASIISKYLRELSMELFNEFWQKHCDNLKPTRGYPQDAVRFRSDVAKTLLKLNIAESDFWRNR